jgi:hypothetical protein
MHTPDTQWQDWFLGHTGIPCTVHFEDVPPARYVCFCDRDRTELWRAPLAECPSPSVAANLIPPALHIENITLTVRKKLLSTLIENPDVVMTQARALPEIQDIAIAVAHSPLANARRDRSPTVFEWPAELRRQWEEILLHIDDVTAQRLLDRCNLPST